MNKKFSSILAAGFLIGAFVATAALAAPAPADKKALIANAAALINRIPAKQRQTVSSAMQRVLQINALLTADRSKINDEGTVNVPPRLGAARTLAAAAAASLGPIPNPGAGGAIAVSDPRVDFVDSVMAGFTQSETSSAWCGNTVVAGYNDSGAFGRTAGVDFNSPWSFSSASYSSDGGRTFTSSGYMNPGSNWVNFIVGDPTVVCTSPSQFYYSSIYAFGQNSAGDYFNGVAVNISSDGGRTWSEPVAAVERDLSHGIDKPWMAADPTNPSRLYVSYTDFDGSGTRCLDDFRFAIELVVSNDKGATWSDPVVVHEECYFTGTQSGVQGSSMAVGADGTLYLAYEFFPAGVPNNEIHLVKSTDHGQTVSAPIKVSDVWPNGNFGLYQGGFRNNEFPQIAVDRTRGGSRGTIYLTWSDGINNIQPDLPLPYFYGTYAYSDIMVSRSTDGGRSFSLAMPVSPQQVTFTGRGRDQFFPGIAVDRRGRVGVCYYDRRQSPDNALVDRYCSQSNNGGTSWSEQRVSSGRWLPAHHTDDFINRTYIGDYDALSSDFLLQRGGFFGTFEVQTNGNPDVVGARFGGGD